MAAEEPFDLTLAQARRHRDAQALAAGIDPQRQPPCAFVLHDPERQRAPGHMMLALLDRGGPGLGQVAEEGEGHKRNISDSEKSVAVFAAM